MLPKSDSICGRLTKDFLLGCIQGGSAWVNLCPLKTLLQQRLQVQRGNLELCLASADLPRQSWKVCVLLLGLPQYPMNCHIRVGLWKKYHSVRWWGEG